MRITENRIINAQDALLNYVRKNKIQVTVFLLNGVKMVGLVTCFDHSCIFFKKEEYTQLIYKHAISTISPHSNINIFEGDNGLKKLKNPANITENKYKSSSSDTTTSGI